MSMRQLVHRMNRISARIPQPSERPRFRIAMVNGEGEIEEYLLIENDTHRWVAPEECAAICGDSQVTKLA